MAFRIQIRRDKSVKWAVNNPVLLEGEIGYETDTQYMKIGNGVSTWNELAYWIGENIRSYVPKFSIKVSASSGIIDEVIESSGPDGNSLDADPWNFEIGISGGNITVAHNTGLNISGLFVFGATGGKYKITQPNGISEEIYSLESDVDSTYFTIYNVNSGNTGCGVTGPVLINWLFN